MSGMKQRGEREKRRSKRRLSFFFSSFVPYTAFSSLALFFSSLSPPFSSPCLSSRRCCSLARACPHRDTSSTMVEAAAAAAKQRGRRRRRRKMDGALTKNPAVSSLAALVLALALAACAIPRAEVRAVVGSRFLFFDSSAARDGSSCSL